MNVFSGPDSIIDFHDPDKNPPLPLVELPTHPFSSKNIRIYAKMLTMLPSTNVKALAARNMIDRGKESGEYDPAIDRIVEYSSGNTITSIAIYNTMRGGQQAEAYISNKTSAEKINMLRFFGLELSLFGGPAQVEPADSFGGIAAAIRKGQEPGFWNPGQYHNHSNTEAHLRWTGPQLSKQLPSISIFAASIGTSGTMTGTGAYLKKIHPKLINLGVFTSPSDRVPGPRPIDLVQTIDLPWQEVIDESEHVSSFDSYRTSLELCRQGILAGPSTGLTLAGLYQYLDKLENCQLDELRDADGVVTCVFICCDLPHLYLGDYFNKLPNSYFPKINNTELMDVDLHPYAIDAKLTPSKAYTLLKGGQKREITIIDLRHGRAFGDSQISLDFSASSVSPLIMNIPVQDCSDKPVNAFLHSPTLAAQYKVLEEVFGETLPYGLTGRDVLLVCTYGTISSTACSIIRAHHGESMKAWYIVGGMESWQAEGLPVSQAS